ncbi:hypothetical protein GCM10028820_00890 [Tessaracoccus terricola]
MYGGSGQSGPGDDVCHRQRRRTVQEQFQDVEGAHDCGRHSGHSSRSAGPGTRANIDEFTETTAEALKSVGGATHGKAVIILNPAEPPALMRDTLYALVDDADRDAIAASVRATVDAVAEYVPGYRLKQQVQFDAVENANVPVVGNFTGLRVTVFLEVEGAADYLPAYAGNLDIMTSAAARAASLVADRLDQAVGV